MADGNGQGKSRLDRIEEMIERHIIANEAAHASFRADYQVLLAAQVVFQGNLAKLEEKMAETTEKLDALIKINDEWVRNNSRGGESK